MKCEALVVAYFLTACSPSPVVKYASEAEPPVCEVSYPRIPLCECGCLGNMCITSEIGAAQCGVRQSLTRALASP
jgi:hypothetical protein